MEISPILLKIAHNYGQFRLSNSRFPMDRTRILKEACDPLGGPDGDGKEDDDDDDENDDG
jgi:hypothetical protein